MTTAATQSKPAIRRQTPYSLIGVQSTTADRFKEQPDPLAEKSGVKVTYTTLMEALLDLAKVHPDDLVELLRKHRARR